MKQCSKCKKEKDTNHFSVRTEKKNGKTYSYLKSWCKSCLNQKGKEIFKEKLEYYIERNRKTLEKHRRFLQDIKNVPCKDCLESFHYCVMEFDHLPEFKKEFNISRVSQRIGREKLLNEIAKCEVVCSNCHRIRTYKRKYPTGYVLKRKSKINEYIKSLKVAPCTDCEKTYPFYVTDFDHRPNEIKNFNIAEWMKQSDKSKERIIQEINKCDLLCTNCHRLRSFNNKVWIIT